MELFIEWPRTRKTISNHIKTTIKNPKTYLIIGSLLITKWVVSVFGEAIKAKCKEKYHQACHLNRIKLFYRSKVLLIQLLPSAYYFVLPHLIHKGIISFHTRYNHGKSWYGTYSQFISFTLFYSSVFYSTGFLLKRMIPPDAMTNFQQKFFEISVIKSLEKVKDKKIESINDMLQDKYDCPQVITSVIWSYVFDQDSEYSCDQRDIALSWFIDKNQYTMQDFVGDILIDMNQFSMKSKSRYDRNPILYLHGVSSKSRHFLVCSMAVVANFFTQVFFDVLLILRFNFQSAPQMLGCCCCFLSRYPICILIDLVTRNEFIFGPKWFGGALMMLLSQEEVQHAEHFSGDRKLSKLLAIVCENWSSIIDNGKKESSWYSTSADELQIECVYRSTGSVLVHKTDLETQLATARNC